MSDKKKEVVKKTVLEVISDESKWCHDGGYANDKFGETIGACTPDAICWCIMGAIYNQEFSSSEIDSKVLLLDKAIADFTGRPAKELTMSIFEFNDADDTTYEMICEVVESAGV